MYPDKIRVSTGTAAVLGLKRIHLDVNPTTAYLMTYSEDGCIANCAFCPQGRESTSDRSLLSRVLWPVYSTKIVLESLEKIDEGEIRRICIQAINYPGFFEDVLYLLKAFKEHSSLDVSLDSPPLNKVQLEKLKAAGLEKIAFPLDASTPDIFDRVKGKLTRGPYRWNEHLKALGEAVSVFGEGNVMSNLIVGLGETEKEAVELIQLLQDRNVGTVLYAFTPVHGTFLEGRDQPELASYRRIQVARLLISEGIGNLVDMKFDVEGKIVNFGLDEGGLKEVVLSGRAFMTSGCEGCNRPYYNERPSGPFYNYPREPTREESEDEAKKMGFVFGI
jgi:biotin synthase